jgi:hypothetical protein
MQKTIAVALDGLCNSMNVGRIESKANNVGHTA